MIKSERTTGTDLEGNILRIGDEVIVLQYKNYLHRGLIIRFTPHKVVIQTVGKMPELITQVEEYIIKTVVSPRWRLSNIELPSAPGKYLVQHGDGVPTEVVWDNTLSRWEYPIEVKFLHDVVKWAEIPV